MSLCICSAVESLLRKSLSAAAKMRRRTHAKKLRVTDTVPLGERRFVAVVQFEKERFLIGGCSGAISLLANLHPENAAADFKTVLNASEESGITVQ